ncbi:HipA N-terminal domain-containing protein [Escherichia coli]|uniref:HipA N-terminal domain-containing protein n=1 Tax=Escherichia coli TaxID=562 RepID=UPI000BDF68AD|nr:HipA N-terminal domain-containing protein [Escherichia coli]
MPKLVTWMNNQRVGELTKLANGAHTFKYAPEWLASRYARPLSLSLPLQRGNITSDAVFNFFDNLLPDSPIVRDRIVKRYHAKSRQPFDLLSEIGRDSVGAVTLLPENETITRPIMAWEKLTEARLEEVLTAYKADIPLGMIREENDFRISVAGAQEKTALLRIGNDWCIPKGITPTTHIIKLPIGEIRQPNATLDLSQSVDNEYYCLLLAKELGLNVPDAEIIKAGKRFPEVQMHEILSDFARMIPAALDNVKTSLPTDFPENVVTAVETNVLRLHGRLSREYGSK